MEDSALSTEEGARRPEAPSPARERAELRVGIGVYRSGEPSPALLAVTAFPGTAGSESERPLG